MTRPTEALDIEACYTLMRSGALRGYEAMLKSEDAQEGEPAHLRKNALRCGGGSE
ncbi:MAG: hypothetical protein R3245_05190 [Kiloniellales bacterium]|nr:hypothetical protein [Kiloniellales bacterium]